MSGSIELPNLRIRVPPKYKPLLRPARYKILKGGRGSAKTESIGRIFIGIAATDRKRFLCTREYQSSIRDSVHYTLSSIIYEKRLQHAFTITDHSIKSWTGSEFIFKGINRNIEEFKSTADIDYCWMEEGQTASKRSLDVIPPTLRNEGAEIWISYNPLLENAPVHQLAAELIKNPYRSGKLWGTVLESTWRDNPFMSQTLHEERLWMLEKDPVLYQHIWEGECLLISNAVIFKDKFKVHDFETPADVDFHHGVDFGFADDPGCMIRSYQTEHESGRDLWIDREAYRYHVELDDLPKLYDEIGPTARTWPIFADNSQPQTISYIGRQGFNMMPATKWAGSVEDGITFLKGFRCIHIHPRCENMIREAALYAYKTDPKQVDPRTGQELVLPIILDKHNHAWDAVRYSLDGYITNNADLSVWRRQ